MQEGPVLSHSSKISKHFSKSLPRKFSAKTVVYSISVQQKIKDGRNNVSNHLKLFI
jgi:hypothetical protein